MTLPPIDEWWPELSDEAQRAVLGGGSRHLDDDVREQIREITGAVVGMIESLSDDDLAYAREHAPADD
ncbi:hypothetical protein [Microbacterium paraoxydans]|uniref:Uncharacterized protein n=1 Tax=Microbacterium paraoxydans TaxID=199592 RepID=A0ABS5IKT3_9MICO|nr:hypothetical protein [Microbacterium paraoxydans]MBS0023566.1 hypothetical protein [Microbacterium paraoxydans]